MFDLTGKRALVTGASGGIGGAIATALHGAGATVGLSGTRTAPLEELAASLGERAHVLPCNLSDAEAVNALPKQAIEAMGGLDILVNNAGVGYLFGPFVEQTQEKWDTVLDVNLRGAFFAMKYAIRQMQAQDEQPGWGRGRIVSIGSRGSKSGSALTSSYIASKHGLVGLTRSVAIEMGPSQINVNMVCPNHVTTGLGSWQNEYMAQMRGQSVEEYLEAMRGRIPLGRVGTPEDTANACAFLCSGQARYITGEAMNVSGGEEMH